MHEPHHHLLRLAQRISANPADRHLLSTGQLLSVALILNEPKWIADAGYSLSGALERLGPLDVEIALQVAREQPSR